MRRLAPRFLGTGDAARATRWTLWRTMALGFRAGLYASLQTTCRVCEGALSNTLAGAFLTVSCRNCNLSTRIVARTVFCCDSGARLRRVAERCHGCRVRRVCVTCPDSATCACAPRRLWCGMCAQTRLTQHASGACRCADCSPSQSAATPSSVGAVDSDGEKKQSMWALEADGMEDMSLPGSKQRHRGPSM